MFVFSTSQQGFTPSPDYFRSKQGVLRIAEAVISLCGIICYSQTDFCKSIAMYNFVVIVTLILSILIMVASLFESTRTLTYNRLVVFINDIVFSILYMIVTILSFLSIDGCWTNKAARTAQSIFGVGGTFVVACLAILGYMEMKESSSKANPNPNAVVVDQNSAPPPYQAANSNVSPTVNQPAPSEPAFVVPLPKVNLNVNVPVRF